MPLFFTSIMSSKYPQTVLRGCADVRAVCTDEQIAGKPAAEYRLEGYNGIHEATPHPGKEDQFNSIVGRLRELELIQPIF